MKKEKTELRQKLISKLLSLTKQELKRRSENVGEKLSELLLYKEAKLIMAYYPLRGEVDIREIVRKGLKTKRFCFPVMDVQLKRLRVFEVKNLDQDFLSGPFGVREPDIKNTREVDTGEIDIIIVPGLAFDTQKNRLGRGAGFYDRFLKKIKGLTKKIGVAFDFQIIESLPVRLSFDEKVDIVVSEDFVIK